MEIKAKELFLKNYSNQGDCEGLMGFAKNFDKDFKSGTKKKISYLPWAIVERIFRLQGGKVEIVSWNLEIPFKATLTMPNENGEIITAEKTSNALFLHLKGTWQGEELEEFYPIFDNQTARTILLPDAQDLNTARQRGSVRLIARLAGIGLSIFEQQDPLDDDNLGAPVEPQNPKKVEPKKPTGRAVEPTGASIEPEKISAKEKKPLEEKIISKPDVSDVGTADLLDLMSGKIVAPIEPAKQTIVMPTETVEDYDKESEQYADKKLEVKKYVSTHKDFILNYIKEKGKEKLGDLVYSELSALVELLKNQ